MNITDWITAISTLIIAIFTIKLACIAKDTADSWKEQRKPEAIRTVIGYILEFSQYSYRITRSIDISVDDFIGLRTIFEKIEPALIYLFYFTEENRENIEKKYRNLWIRLENIQKEDLICKEDVGKCIRDIAKQSLEDSEALIELIAKDKVLEYQHKYAHLLYAHPKFK